MTWLAVLAAVLLAAGGLAVAHSRFTADLAVIDRAWADLAADFRRRHELIPRLVETARGYARHLGPDLDEVVVARARAIQMARQAQDRVGLRAEAENDLTLTIARVVASIGELPDVDTSGPMPEAAGAITALQGRITADALVYNLAVQGHNRRVRAAGTRVIAALFGVERRPYLTLVDPVGVRPFGATPPG